MNDPSVSSPGEPATAERLALLAANHQAFLAFLERRVGRRDLAEDLLQEAFARGADKIESLRNDESIVAWFYRVLRNAIVDHRRRQGVAQRALDELARELDEAPTEETRAAVCQCVARLASTLKPEYAEALQKIEIEGLAVKAFAEAQGISSGNAAVRVFRAREALRRQVIASCGSCADEGCHDCSCAAPAPAPEPGGCHRKHDG